MDRLTEKTIGCFEFGLKNHTYTTNDFGTYDAFYAYNVAIKRLGQYEETGLKPDEINKLRAENQRLREALEVAADD